MTQGRAAMALAAVATMLTGTGADRPEGDAARLQGTWEWVSAEFNGRKAHPENFSGYRRVFRGDQWANLQGAQPLERGTFRIDAGRSPRAIDFTYTDGQVYQGIYKLRGDVLEVCTAVPGRGRPTRFASRPDSGWGLVVYRRARP